MSSKQEPITKTKQATAPQKASGDNILKKVVSVNLKNIDKATIKDITDNIIDNADLQDNALKNSSKKLVANCIKLSISAQHPELYKYYKKLDYDQLMNLVDMKQATAPANAQMLTMSIPQEALATLPNSDTVGLYGTSFSISPNSFWANVTNILNEVSVGDNFINTGESFNAWEFYRDATLASGEASLKTIGQTLSGICLLNQNYLVPPNTQMLKGYQASLGVFINVDSAQDVGGGTGIGLFTMYATPINVIKLAVTNPQQFAEMVRIFEATAVNSREYSLWMITTYNLLSNITNIIVDNYNTNIRNCLNGTLFPAIQIMKNPTNEFNLGLIQTAQWYNNGSDYLFQILNYEAITSGSLNNINVNAQTSNSNNVYTQRHFAGQLTLTPGGTTAQNVLGTFTSPYTVPGSATYPRIQTSLYNDMHLIIAPEFFVALKSGTLSQLFHWEFQRLEEYIPPENIHMLYKQINIPSGYLQDGNVASGDGNETGYAWNVRASLGERWFPSNVIYLVTKPADSNQWSAAYGWVWTTDMRNEWGAGMIATTFLHYALYGGVIPWANGCCFYFKNLMNLVSDETQQITTDFTLGALINQNQTPPTSSGSGSN